jgi:IclR family transcriptional regulator, pca regulon regulatory protein
MADNPKNMVMSVAKAFSVLRAFSQDLPTLTVSDIAARTGLDRGTAFRMVHTLRELGYVAAIPSGKGFRLTLKCLELGYVPLARADLKTLAQPLLDDVVPVTADAASLGVLDGGDVVYLARAQGAWPRQSLDRRIGSRTGAYATALGHAILAFLPPRQQYDILSATPMVRLSERTLTDIDQLIERLALVRARGYALSDRENAYDLRTVAAPVFDQHGQPVAGISITICAERMEMDPFVARGLPLVQKIAGELSDAIRLTFGAVAENGYRP